MAVAVAVCQSCLDTRDIDCLMAESSTKMNECPGLALEILDPLDKNSLPTIRTRAGNALPHSMALDKNYIDIANDRSPIRKFVKWPVAANACAAIYDYDGLPYALGQYLIYGGKERLPYFWLKAMIQELSGLCPDALDSYKWYVACLNEDKLSAIESDTRFVEESYKSKLKSSRLTIATIVIFSSSLVFALVLAILLRRVKNANEENRVERMRHEEEREAMEGEIRKVEARCRSLEEEKAETERMSVSLKTEVKRLTDIMKDNSIRGDILSSVEKRLDVLNMFVLAEMSDSFEKIAHMELCKLMENRADFLVSTKNTFMISHSRFITFLSEHGLSEWEIGCCCLYCIGFNGAEVSEYLNRKAIYNVNSSIRQKLKIPKGKSQIDVFLKLKMKEFHV